MNSKQINDAVDRIVQQVLVSGLTDHDAIKKLLKGDPDMARLSADPVFKEFIVKDWIERCIKEEELPA